MMLRSLRSVARFRRFEWRSSVRRLSRAANIEDLRTLARRRLPRGVFDYVDGAAEDEITATDNVKAFRDIRFKPRVLCDVSACDSETRLLGRKISFPLVLAPTGFTRIVHPEGELAVARAAALAGIPYALSTMSTRSIEEVAAVSNGVKWFQVYAWRDRALIAELMGRADAAGFDAVVLTVDLPVLGRRERDVRNGLQMPPEIGLRTLIDGVLHPGWTWDFVRSAPILFANISGYSAVDGSDPVRLASYVNEQFDASLSWDDLAWFRSVWKGPIVIKGIQTVEDARIAVDHGIEAIALSNHGGRQLDGAPVPLELLPLVAEAVGGDVEILCDGGIRRGSDIAKAVALGATACMAGRPYLYGLGAAGQRGVEFAVEHLRDGFVRTLALLGGNEVGDLDAGLLDLRR
jgi:L-lactate dehydrogenase (cytochrome)